MSKYFLDFEFLEVGKCYMWPIIIGIVCETGKEYYAVFHKDALAALNCPFKQGEWLRENVFPHIDWKLAKTDDQILKDIVRFVGDDKRPEFWGYYCDYDWVLFCSIFGTMMDLPPHFPKYCLDIKQYAHMVGNPRLPKQTANEHHALYDARWIRETYDWLNRHHPYMENV